MTQNNDTLTSASATSLSTNSNAAQNRDPMAQILYAYDLESQGNINAAREVYQKVIEEDIDGTYAAIAMAAIAAMGEPSTLKTALKVDQERAIAHKLRR